MHLSPGDDTFNRFVGHFASYVGAVSTEAKYRTDNVVLNSAAYDVIRRENSAVRCCFGLIGCMLKLDLPDAVFEHPLFHRMHLAAVDMVTWANVSFKSPLYVVCLLTINDFWYRMCIRMTWNTRWVT